MQYNEKELIDKIKKKKELADLPYSFVKEMLTGYLQKSRLIPPFSKNQEKIIIKEIRSRLRRHSGMFQGNTSQEKKISLLESKSIKELLMTHSSTRERIQSNSYSKITQEISKINPRSILDLGCGLNPIAIGSRIQKTTYFALDIKENDIDLVRRFFKKNKITGKAYTSDIVKEEKFPQADLCLIFKVLDIIDSKGHKNSENLLKRVPSKIIIASFSTKTLSGKPMKQARRIWLEKMCDRLGCRTEKFRTSNEIFYLIEKQQSI